MSDGWNSAEVVRVLDIDPDTLASFAEVVPALRPEREGFTLRVMLGLHVIHSLPGLALVDAEAIALAAMVGAREGGTRTIAARWPNGRKLKLSWLRDDDIPWGARLTGACVLVAVERMLTDITARAASIRAEAVRIN
jgi:hypothetical protein